MDELIERILYTLNQIPVSGIENHERMCGVVSGIRTIQRMIHANEEKENKEDLKNG